ncbi:MAG TPA: sigma-54 dependent transcriptional regulator, partial [Acidobacteriota bacterium]|nr:sigma-54 dependent transcriptional regulator [Acidobacteriota bacterium]
GCPGLLACPPPGGFVKPPALRVVADNEARMKYKILVIDDEEAARYGIRKAIQTKENLILEAPDLRSARFTIDKENPDLLLLDVNLPDGSGLDLLKELSARPRPPTIIVITAHGSERLAIEAIRSGAYEYLSKPFEVDELRLLVRNARERAQLAEENRALREELGREGGFGAMIGNAPPMQKIFEVIERVAPTDVTVFIQGESGTGKELVAREIHRRSGRASMPFVAVNCAALPDSLIESELFGHEKGAFTGAIARRRGKFEQADGGTIFLDEIGDMALATQAKILRILEERKFEPLGSHESHEVDVRIVCATHRDLGAAIAASEFREDLYYRIHVVRLELPQLRERVEDIEPLAEYFGRVFAEKYHIAWGGFTDAARARLLDYPWPGNVRELRNIVERSIVLSIKGPIDVADLPAELLSVEQRGPATTRPDDLWQLPYEEARSAFERKYLLDVLDRHGGNISQAAAAIRIHRQTLQYKLKQLGIRKSWSE